GEAPYIKTLPEDFLPPLEEADADFGFGTARGCDANWEVVEVPACAFGDLAGSRTVVVLGDSNAFMWLPAFDQIGKRLHWKVIVLAKNSCPPIYMLVYLWAKQ